MLPVINRYSKQPAVISASARRLPLFVRQGSLWQRARTKWVPSPANTIWCRWSKKRVVSWQLNP